MVRMHAEGEAGWSFVVFARDAEDNIFPVHAAWGPVIAEPLQEGWCGAAKLGSGEAEIEALIHAFAWKVASFTHIPTTFKFDNNAAGFAAAGLWSFRPKLKHMRVLRALVQLADTVAPNSQHFAHVSAHKGIHGNEIADILAKAGRTAERPSGALPLNLFPYINSEPMQIEWLWIWFKQCDQDSALPDFVENGACQFEKSADEDILPDELLGTELASAKAIKKFDFGIASFNVCSFKDHESGPTLWGHGYIREQLVSHGIHVACFQETRAKESGIVTSSTHFRCISCAVSGKGGVEVWLMRKQPGSSRVLVRQQDIAVVEANSELLAVKVTYSTLSLLIIAAHAPQSGRSDAEIDHWWRSLDSTIRNNIEPRFEVILGIDANAHFDGAHLPNIGDFGAEARANRASYRFCELLQTWQLVLPATFDNFHHGTHHMETSFDHTR